MERGLSRCVCVPRGLRRKGGSFWAATGLTGGSRVKWWCARIAGDFGARDARAPNGMARRWVRWRGVGGEAAVRGVHQGQGCAEPGQRLPSQRRRQLEVEVVRPAGRSGRKTGAATFAAPCCGTDGTAHRGSQGRAAIAAPIRGKPGASTSVPWLRLRLLTLPRHRRRQGSEEKGVEERRKKGLWRRAEGDGEGSGSARAFIAAVLGFREEERLANGRRSSASVPRGTWCTSGARVGGVAGQVLEGERATVLVHAVKAGSTVEVSRKASKGSGLASSGFGGRQR